MNERCKTAHAKLLAGTCAWCGAFIIEGKAVGRADDDGLRAHLIESDKGAFAQTLQDHVRAEQVLAVAEAVRLVKTITHKLAQNHKTHSVYGCLSPINIGLLSGEPTLREVRAARALDGLQDASSDLAGVVDYMAPEQALNTPRVDRRADIYSLGCVLYFMLAGRAPFPTGTIAERLLQHQNKEPAPLATVRAEIPAGLEAICRKMLEKEPEDRYQSAEDVILAIGAWKADVL